MPKGFSFINVLIIIGLITLAFLGYQEYKKSSANKISQANIATSTNQTTAGENATSSSKSSATISKTNGTKSTTSKSTVEKQTATTSQSNSSQPPAQPGFYQNNTYHYSISYPTNWPIRIRSEAEVAIGTVPPKNGQGAITIEISNQSSNELEQSKAEAQKYSGIIEFKEEKITLTGVEGDKYTIINNIAKITDIYIVLKKNNLYYYLKYTEESSDFVKQVNDSLKTFKFYEK